MRSEFTHLGSPSKRIHTVELVYDLCPSNFPFEVFGEPTNPSSSAERRKSNVLNNTQLVGFNYSSPH
jgi:hypothetical protein